MQTSANAEFGAVHNGANLVDTTNAWYWACFYEKSASMHLRANIDKFAAWLGLTSPDLGSFFSLFVGQLAVLSVVVSKLRFRPACWALDVQNESMKWLAIMIIIQNVYVSRMHSWKMLWYHCITLIIRYLDRMASFIHFSTHLGTSMWANRNLITRNHASLSPSSRAGTYKPTSGSTNPSRNTSASRAAYLFRQWDLSSGATLRNSSFPLPPYPSTSSPFQTPSGQFFAASTPTVQMEG